MDTFIFKYTKTLARIILTGNRLGRVTGNETVNVFITLVLARNWSLSLPYLFIFMPNCIIPYLKVSFI